MKSRKPDQRPAFQFYPDDWLADANLALCDLSAQGLCIRLLCLMFKMQYRGRLAIDDGSRTENRAICTRPLTIAEVSRMSSKPQAEVEANLKQLLDYGVLEKDADGTIYSRRQVREEKQRRSKAEAGRVGGLKAKRGSSSPSPSSISPLPPLIALWKETTKDTTYDRFLIRELAELIQFHGIEKVKAAIGKAHPGDRMSSLSSLLNGRKPDGRPASTPPGPCRNACGRSAEVMCEGLCSPCHLAKIRGTPPTKPPQHPSKGPQEAPNDSQGHFPDTPKPQNGGI